MKLLSFLASVVPSFCKKPDYTYHGLETATTLQAIQSYFGDGQGKLGLEGTIAIIALRNGRREFSRTEDWRSFEAHLHGVFYQHAGATDRVYHTVSNKKGQTHHEVKVVRSYGEGHTYSEIITFKTRLAQGNL